MPFEQNYNGRTFAEYQKISLEKEKADKNVNWNDDKDIYDKVETDYWNKVEHQIGDPYKIEYAADLDVL